MGNCYNICSGKSVSNLQILEVLKHRFGDRVKIKNAPERKGDVKHTKGNYIRARNDFGYFPLVLFWEGLEKTLEWWDI